MHGLRVLSLVVYWLNTNKILGFSEKGKKEHAAIHCMTNLKLAHLQGGDIHQELRDVDKAKHTSPYWF